MASTITLRARHAVLVALTIALTAILAALTPTIAAAEEPGTGVQAANEVLIQNADGRWEHFRVDSCRLSHRWELTAGGTVDWSGWANLGGCLLYDQIDVGMNANGRLEVFGVGTNKAMYHIWQGSPGGGWSGWASLGGGFNGPPTVGYTSYGGIIVFGLGLDNQRYRRHQTQPSCCWSSGWIRG